MNSSNTYKERWLVLSMMCLTLFIISIDNTVLNLALPSISQGLGATASQLQWVVDSYTLIFASSLITTGSIGDRYGRKLLLVLGLFLFGIGSLGAALSTSTNMLIGFRLLLGLAGSMIMPSTLSILTNVFPDDRERAKAIAIWSGVFSVGAGIGPVIGGLLIDAFGWASVFYLNLPIVAICLLGVFRLVPESKDTSNPKPDLPGVALSTVGLLTLIFGIIRAGEAGWTSQTVLFSSGVAVVLLSAFTWWENHSPNPMLPLVFFKNMSFTGANAGLTISSFAMLGSMYFFSQYFQSVQGYSPLVAAIMMLPMTPAVLLSTMGSIRFNRHFGTKLTMSMGLLLSGLGLFLFSLFAGISTPYWYALLAILVLGLGIGFTVSPATNAVMNSLPPNRAGIGSAMNDTTRQLGGALGVAVLGALMNGTYRTEMNQLTGTAGVTSGLLEQIRGSIQIAHSVAAKLDSQLASLVVQTSSQAFVDGMKETLLIACMAMVAAAIAAWLILPAKEAVAEPAHREQRLTRAE